MAGTLFVVATPIGNLDDLTRRAEDTLRRVSRVVAEDTRRTRALLSHLGIVGTKVDRLDAHASPRDIARVVGQLASGEDIALCTDAGTPAVSDPGALLVAASIAEGVTVVPLPGASAPLAALSVSGFSPTSFAFFGFLPRTGRERDAILARIAAWPDVAILFESPHRLTETLLDVSRVSPGREAVIARELSKLHEELIRGTVDDLASLNRDWLGEVTVVLGPQEAPVESGVEDVVVDGWIDAELARGAHAREAASIVAARSGRQRREVYARVLTRRGAVR